MQYPDQERRAEALHGVSGQGQQKNLQERDQVRMSHVPGSVLLAGDLVSLPGRAARWLSWFNPEGQPSTTQPLDCSPRWDEGENRKGKMEKTRGLR